MQSDEFNWVSQLVTLSGEKAHFILCPLLGCSESSDNTTKNVRCHHTAHYSNSPAQPAESYITSWCICRPSMLPTSSLVHSTHTGINLSQTCEGPTFSSPSPYIPLLLSSLPSLPPLSFLSTKLPPKVSYYVCTLSSPSGTWVKPQPFCFSNPDCNMQKLKIQLNLY